MNIRVRAIFKGHVQGVFFRHYTQQKALEEGVKGWVKNRYDGTVEAVFEGAEESVNRVVAWCRYEQPYAKVSAVELKREKYTGEFVDFKIKY
jgi:acylphosphatase